MQFLLHGEHVVQCSLMAFLRIELFQEILWNFGKIFGNIPGFFPGNLMEIYQEFTFYVYQLRGRWPGARGQGKYDGVQFMAPMESFSVWAWLLGEWRGE